MLRILVPPLLLRRSSFAGTALEGVGFWCPCLRPAGEVAVAGPPFRRPQEVVTAFSSPLVKLITPCSLLSLRSLDLVHTHFILQRFGILEHICVLLVLAFVVWTGELVAQGAEHVFSFDFLALLSVLLGDNFVVSFLHLVEIDLSDRPSGEAAVFPTQPPLRRPALRLRVAADLLQGRWRSFSVPATMFCTRSVMNQLGIPSQATELLQNPAAFVQFLTSDVFGRPSQLFCYCLSTKCSFAAVAAPVELVGDGADAGTVGSPELSGSMTCVQGFIFSVLLHDILHVLLGCITAVEFWYSTGRIPTLYLYRV